MRREIFGISVGWFVGIALVVLGLVFGSWLYLQFEKDLIDKQYDNTKHSQPYVESTNNAIRELITEFHKAETGYLEYKTKDATTALSYQGQMTSYLNQIYAQAYTLDKSELGEDIVKFMADHPKPNQ